MATHGCNVPVSPLTLSKWYFGTAAAAAKACDWATANCTFSLLGWVFAALLRWRGCHCTCAGSRCGGAGTSTQTRETTIRTCYSWRNITALLLASLLASHQSAAFWFPAISIILFPAWSYQRQQKCYHRFPLWHSVFRFGPDRQMIPRGQHGSFSALPCGTNLVSFNKAVPATCPCLPIRKVVLPQL